MYNDPLNPYEYILRHKMNSSNNTSKGGIGFCGVLTIVFIILKLIGKINWSWIWVLSPLWIGFIGWILLIIIYVLLQLWIYKNI